MSMTWSGNRMNDRIAKEKLNVILVVDTSKSMAGERISQVNQAIRDIKDYLVNLQVENSNVDFYLSIIQFSTESSFINDNREVNVDKFKFDNLKCCGWSNLHCGYQKLEEILKKQSHGGVMPDFGGTSPIILLLTDGHPTTTEYKDELVNLNNSPWFKAAIRYGIAIELHDKRTMGVLKDFVGDNGDVIDCYSSSMLKNIIKIIVLTASKVKSSSATVGNGQVINQNQLVRQEINEALADVDQWGW